MSSDPQPRPLAEVEEVGRLELAIDQMVKTGRLHGLSNAVYRRRRRARRGWHRPGSCAMSLLT